MNDLKEISDSVFIKSVIMDKIATASFKQLPHNGLYALGHFLIAGFWSLYKNRR